MTIDHLVARLEALEARVAALEARASGALQRPPLRGPGEPAEAYIARCEAWQATARPVAPGLTP